MKTLALILSAIGLSACASQLVPTPHYDFLGYELDAKCTPEAISAFLAQPSTKVVVIDDIVGAWKTALKAGAKAGNDVTDSNTLYAFSGPSKSGLSYLIYIAKQSPAGAKEHEACHGIAPEWHHPLTGYPIRTAELSK